MQDIIPDQHRGARTGATARLEAPTRHDAIILFKNAKSRLLDVNNWHHLCGKASAEFHLTDSAGNLIYKKQAEEGNLIRISLPAPPNPEGGGYDWVKIEKFENNRNMLKDEEIFGFRVRPTEAPDQKQRSSAHFFAKDATSTFLVVRNTNMVTALERGRNEMPNAGAFSVISKVRNVVIALAAMLGMSNPQWKSLVNGIIRGPQEDK